MPCYRVHLEGENFWLQMEGKKQRMGFYTTRFLEAASLDEARETAVNLIGSEERLKPLNDRGDPPRIIVTGVEEVENADVPRVVRGYAFFPDEPQANG